VQRTHSYLGVLKRPDGSLEQLVIRSENGGEIMTIEMVKEYYNGFSFQERDFSIIMESIGAFYCYFLHNENTESDNFLVGFWSGGNSYYGNNPNAGRILIKPTSNADIYPEKLTSTSIEYLNQYFGDTKFVKGIFKYFWPSNESAEQYDEFVNIHEKIENLALKFSKGISEIKEVTDKLNSEIDRLKEKLIQEKPNLQLYIKLKISVSKGKLKQVFSEIEEIIDHDRDRDIFNDYIIILGRYSELEINKNLGILSNDEYTIQSNQVRKALVDLIDRISEIYSKEEIKKD